MKKFFVFVLASLGLGAFAQDKPAEPVRVHSLTGNIQPIPDFESKVMGNKRDLIVYLPPDYDKNPKRRYPVLYMHDGQNIFDGFTSYLPNVEWRADESAESLIRSNLIEPIIIVGIANAGAERANEYLPTQMTNKDGSKWGGKADLYGKMITDEIMPLINKKYRTKTGPGNTGLCGSSFGGIVTLHLGMTRPDVFGKLAVVSPSLWWDDNVMLKRMDNLRVKPKSKVWIDMGSQEGPGAVEGLEQLRDEMVRKGWKLGNDLACFVDYGAHHNEVAWDHRFPAMLLFLFGKR